MSRKDFELTEANLDAAVEAWADYGQQQCSLLIWIADVFDITVDEADKVLDRDWNE